MFFLRRKAVSDAAVKKWPGNKIPVFNTDTEAKKELDELVDAIAEDCSYEPAGFTKDSIKQHILDVLNERRRRHRNGHDYTQVRGSFYISFFLSFFFFLFCLELPFASWDWL